MTKSEICHLFSLGCDIDSIVQKLSEEEGLDMKECYKTICEIIYEAQMEARKSGKNGIEKGANPERKAPNH